jgi:hypothetical protein
MTIINQTQIATFGLGDVTSQEAWKVAFPEINFYELFPDTISVRLIQPGGVDFEEEVGSITIKLASSEQQQLISDRQPQMGGDGAGLGNYNKKKQKNEDDYQWRNITRLRTFSIPSEEYVSQASIVHIVKAHSVVSTTVVGTPTVEFNDDEDALIMMLLAA